MCMFSVVAQYGRDQVSPAAWTPDTWRQFKQTATDVKQLDADLGEPNCEDDGKTAWMEEVETRMQALEAHAFRNSAFRGPIPE